MYLVTKDLKFNRQKITDNLLSIIKSIIAMDTTGSDVEKMKAKIKAIEDNRAKLIDLYMSNVITKEEFADARVKYDSEIAELQSVIDSMDKQQAQIPQQQELIQEISVSIKEIIGGVEYEDAFYRRILERIVVNDRDNIDVYLHLLPIKWSYTALKASKKALAPKMVHFRGFSTYIRQQTFQFRIRHREALGKIAQRCTQFAVRPAILADNDLCIFRVGGFDSYGIL